MSPHSGIHFKEQVAFSEHREISVCGLRSVKAFKAALDKAGGGLKWSIFSTTGWAHIGFAASNVISVGYHQLQSRNIQGPSLSVRNG